MMDKFGAMEEIRRLAREFDLAVSVVTVDDVLTIKGYDPDGDVGDIPNDVYEGVVNSWEWKHYGDNWSDWFEGFTLEDAIGAAQ